MKFDYFNNLIMGRGLEATIGMTQENFAALVPVFAETFKVTQEEVKARPEQAPPGLTAPEGPLDTPEKRLFFILYYLKTYPSFDMLGVHFDLSPSLAYDLMIAHIRVLQRSLERLAVPSNWRLDSRDGFNAAISEYDRTMTRSKYACEGLA